MDWERLARHVGSLDDAGQRGGTGFADLEDVREQAEFVRRYLADRSRAVRSAPEAA